ncbi:MAG: hypothetical protein E6R03_15325 [Hyphomicrobiaceae bacterium]|nr:MAG: hypothetical protein E6R03_15325 [Hyphomicrobiaceae bacterium]
MALTFRGTSIPGQHGEILTPAPEPLRSEVQTMGLKGATEVRGQTAARDFSVEVTLYNSYSTSLACDTAIVNLEAMVNTHGSLVETGNISRTFANCTLVAVRRIRGPIPVSGSVTISSGTYTGWMAMLELTFRQLRT